MPHFWTIVSALGDKAGHLASRLQDKHDKSVCANGIGHAAICARSHATTGRFKLRLSAAGWRVISQSRECVGCSRQSRRAILLTQVKRNLALDRQSSTPLRPLAQRCVSLRLKISPPAAAFEAAKPPPLRSTAPHSMAGPRQVPLPTGSVSKSSDRRTTLCETMRGASVSKVGLRSDLDRQRRNRWTGSGDHASSNQFLGFRCV